MLEATKGKVNRKDKVVYSVTVCEELLEPEIFFNITFTGVVYWYKGKVHLFPEVGFNNIRDTVIKYESCIWRILVCGSVAV